jgi:hypothetical protein
MRNFLLGLALLAILSNVVILILIMAALRRRGHKTNMLLAEKGGGRPRNEEGGQEADQFRWPWASRFCAPGEGFSRREEHFSWTCFKRASPILAP